MDIGILAGRLTLEDEASSVLKAFSKNLDSIGDALTGAGKTLSIGLTAPLVAAAGASLVFAGNFEASMTRLVSLAGVSQGELEGVKEHILALAPATGIGPQALAEAMTKVSSTVADTKVALEILDTAARLSAAGMGAAVDVAGAITAVVNSYGAENISAARAADILTQAVKDGGAEAKELAPTLANVVPIAAQLGVGFDEVAANIATVTKLGVPAAEAVTQLSAVMTALLKETDKGATSLGTVGMSYASLRAEIKDKGLAATLTDLTSRFGENRTGLAEVFGRVEALRNVMSSAGQQAETYASVLENVKHSSDGLGQSTEVFNAMQNTSAQRWNQVTASLQAAAISLGDSLKPALIAVIDVVTPLIGYLKNAADWFGKLPGPVQATAIGFIALLAAIGPLLVVVGTIVSSITTLIPLFVGLGAVWTSLTFPITLLTSQIGIFGVATGVSTTAVYLFETAMATVLGPITLVVAGVVALYAALKYFELLDPVVSFFKDVGTIVGGLFSSGFSSATPFVSGLWDTIKGFGSFLSGIFQSDLFQLLVPINAVMDVLKTLGNFLSSTVFPKLKEFRQWVSDLATKYGDLPPVIGAATDGVNKNRKSLEDFKNPILVANNGLDNLTDGLAKGVTAGAKFTTQTKEQIKAADDYAKKLADVNMKIADAVRSVGNLTDAQKFSVVSYKILELTNDEIATKLHVSAGAVKKFDDELVTSAKLADDVAAGQVKIAQYTQDNMNLVAEIMKKRTAEINALVTGGLSDRLAAQRAFDDAVAHDQLSARDQEARLIIQSTNDNIAKLDTLAGNYETTYDMLTATAAIKLSEIGVTWDAETKKWVMAFDANWAKGGWNAPGGMLGTAIPKTVDSLGKISTELTSLSGAFVSLAQIGSSSFGETAKSIGTVVVALDTVIKGIDTYAKSVKESGESAAASFALAATVVGAMVLVVQVAVKSFQDADKALSDYNTNISQLSTITNEFGKTTTFSDSLKSSIESLSETLRSSLPDFQKYGTGGLYAIATALKLTDVIKEMGGITHLTTEQFNGVKTAVDALFFVIGKGGPLSVDAIDSLDKTLVLFGETAVSSSGLVDRFFLDTVAKAQSAGIELKGVNDFLLGQLGNAATGLNQLLLGLQDSATAASQAHARAIGAMTEEQIKNMAKSFTVTAEQGAGLAAAVAGDFAAMVQGGMTFSEALDKLQPSISALSTALKTSGVDGGEAFSLLTNLSAITHDAIMGPLVDAITGADKAIKGLHNSGILNQQMFSALEFTAVDAYNKIISGGGNAAAANLAIAPTLQTLWSLQKDFGYAVDDSTQALIDEAVKVGDVGDKHRPVAEQMLIATQGIQTAVEGLAKVFGVVLPKSAQDGAKGINDELSKIIIPHIPPIHATVVVDYDTSGAPVEGMYAGGVVHAAGGANIVQGPWTPSGSDTVAAMLTPGERVLTVSQNRTYEASRGQSNDDATLRAIAQLHDDLIMRLPNLLAAAAKSRAA